MAPGWPGWDRRICLSGGVRYRERAGAWERLRHQTASISGPYACHPRAYQERWDKIREQDISRVIHQSQECRVGHGPAKRQPEVARGCPNGLIQEAIVWGEVTVIGCKLHSNMRPWEPEPAAPITHVISGMSAGDTAAPWQDDERSSLIQRRNLHKWH